MALDTYANLKTSISNWITHDDADTVADDLIDLFEADARLDDSIAQCYEAETRFSYTADASGPYTRISLPTDWNGARQIRRNCYDMEAATPERFDVIAAENENASTNGTFAGWYTIEGQYLRLHPALEENEEIELLYWKQITALDDTNTTNWLLTLAPNLYLYGSLLHAGSFIKSVEDMQRFEAMYERTRQHLKKNTQDKLYGGGIRRIRTR